MCQGTRCKKLQDRILTLYVEVFVGVFRRQAFRQKGIGIDLRSMRDPQTKRIPARAATPWKTRRSADQKEPHCPVVFHYGRFAMNRPQAGFYSPLFFQHKQRCSECGSFVPPIQPAFRGRRIVSVAIMWRSFRASAVQSSITVCIRL